MLSDQSSADQAILTAEREEQLVKEFREWLKACRNLAAESAAQLSKFEAFAVGDGHEDQRILCFTHALAQEKARL